ncbi:MAG TPA: DUF4296 domain-containing protein [Crocinitomicaceae bacterium]|nr:DUF4296 domain-containing protein [Crocinitomicaceae bacterium]
MKIGVIAIVFIVLTSCIDSSEVIMRKEQPSSLIPQEKFTTVLVEFAKLEGHIEAKYIVANKYSQLMINSGDSLLKSFSLDRATFESSLEYYGSRQELMKTINDDVLDELNKELGELESEDL